MKLRFVTLAVCCALPVLSAEISKVSAAGAVLYRLSNEYLELDVSPEEGGRIVRMFHKGTGRELTPRLSLSNSPGGTGLLNDRVINLNGGTCREYETGTYQVALKEKVDADTEPVTIHVVYPVIGFYTTSEPAEDGIVTEEFQYGGTLAVGETDNSTLENRKSQNPIC